MIRWMERRRLDVETRILGALDAEEWRYGLDLIRASGVRAGRFYVALGRLENASLVEARWDEQVTPRGHRRRMYRLVRS